jgi:hypothetical protein
MTARDRAVALLAPILGATAGDLARVEAALLAVERDALERAAAYVDGKGDEIARRDGSMPIVLYGLADGIRSLQKEADRG